MEYVWNEGIREGGKEEEEVVFIFSGCWSCGVFFNSGQLVKETTDQEGGEEVGASSSRLDLFPAKNPLVSSHHSTYDIYQTQAFKTVQKCHGFQHSLKKKKNQRRAERK